MYKKHLIFIFVTGLLMIQSAFASDLDLDTLLEQVKTGHSQDAIVNKKRIQEFQSNLSQQEENLRKLQAEEEAQEKLSQEREKQFEQNEQNLTLLQQRLDERLGALKELFGVLQQVSSDAMGQFHVARMQLRYPDRTTFSA